MKTSFVVLLLSAAVLGVGRAANAAQIDPPSSAASASTALRMRGTIDKYDATTRMLSLKTADGTLPLSVPPAVRIRQDRHDIEAITLQELSGYRAAVRYSESGGNRTAESIHVFGKNERTGR
jgi:hypothetical protein